MSATCFFSLVGTVNGSPEIRTTAGGTNITTVLLNCQTQKFTGGGMQIDYSDYEVKGFGKIGERLAQLTNGSSVAISGDIGSRQYKSTQTGKPGTATELVARDISVLSDVSPEPDGF